MSTQITAHELAQIVSYLLLNAKISDSEYQNNKFSEFMTEIAAAVCRHAGGEVKESADRFIGEWMIGIHADQNVPLSEGVWARYDTDADLENQHEKRPVCLDYRETPPDILKRLTPLYGKKFTEPFHKVVGRLSRPYYRLTQEQVAEIEAIAVDCDVLLLNGTTQVTWGNADSGMALMPLAKPI
jgi:hypothetical protein